jgi:hypothetical protein
MKLLRNSLSAFFTATTIASSTLILVQPSIADVVSRPIVAPSSLKTSLVSRAITESEVIAAQKAWGEALVAISTTSENVIDAAYGYQFGPVLFKPTLTIAPQTFRTTRAGALSYFVGDDTAFPMDKGFALNNWRAVEIKNAAIFISGNTATTMGNVLITNKDGKITTVDKTWQFFKDDSGKLRIILHHSSLPYTGT